MASDGKWPYSYDWSKRQDFMRTAGYNLQLQKTIFHGRTNVMDAVRPDGQRVVVKAISPSVHPHEIPIGRLFSTPPHSENSGNHCIPFLEVLDDPYDIDKKLIVMPLCIPFDMPDFNTVGEVLDFIKQIFEGIQYMHQNYIAHRDCNFTNIVQEPAVYPDGDFHPAEPWMDSAHEHLAQPITRTECWPRYHIIDFGLSRQYDPSHGLPREGIILGGDQSPPEHRAKSPICNPFPTDIYFLGNLVRGLVRPSRLPGGVSQAPPHRPLSFLLPLIDQMMQKDPDLRPTIGEVIAQFTALRGRLTKADLRQPARPLYWWDSFKHRLRQAKRAWSRVLPLPLYPPHPLPPPLSDEMHAFFTEFTRIPDRRSP